MTAETDEKLSEEVIHSGTKEKSFDLTDKINDVEMSENCQKQKNQQIDGYEQINCEKDSFNSIACSPMPFIKESEMNPCLNSKSEVVSEIPKNDVIEENSPENKLSQTEVQNNHTDKCNNEGVSLCTSGCGKSGKSRKVSVSSISDLKKNERCLELYEQINCEKDSFDSITRSPISFIEEIGMKINLNSNSETVSEIPINSVTVENNNLPESVLSQTKVQNGHTNKCNNEGVSLCTSDCGERGKSRKISDLKKNEQCLELSYEQINCEDSFDSITQCSISFIEEIGMKISLNSNSEMFSEIPMNSVVEENSPENLLSQTEVQNSHTDKCSNTGVSLCTLGSVKKKREQPGKVSVFSISDTKKDEQGLELYEQISCKKDSFDSIAYSPISFIEETGVKNSLNLKVVSEIPMNSNAVENNDLPESMLSQTEVQNNHADKCSNKEVSLRTLDSAKRKRGRPRKVSVCSIFDVKKNKNSLTFTDFKHISKNNSLKKSLDKTNEKAVSSEFIIQTSETDNCIETSVSTCKLNSALTNAQYTGNSNKKSILSENVSSTSFTYDAETNNVLELRTKSVFRSPENVTVAKRGKSRKMFRGLLKKFVCDPVDTSTLSCDVKIKKPTHENNKRKYYNVNEINQQKQNKFYDIKQVKDNIKRKKRLSRHEETLQIEKQNCTDIYKKKENFTQSSVVDSIQSVTQFHEKSQDKLKPSEESLFLDNSSLNNINNEETLIQIGSKTVLEMQKMNEGNSHSQTKENSLCKYNNKQFINCSVDNLIASSDVSHETNNNTETGARKNSSQATESITSQKDKIKFSKEAASSWDKISDEFLEKSGEKIHEFQINSILDKKLNSKVKRKMYKPEKNIVFECINDTVQHLNMRKPKTGVGNCQIPKRTSSVERSAELPEKNLRSDLEQSFLWQSSHKDHESGIFNSLKNNSVKENYQKEQLSQSTMLTANERKDEKERDVIMFEINEEKLTTYSCDNSKTNKSQFSIGNDKKSKFPKHASVVCETYIENLNITLPSQVDSFSNINSFADFIPSNSKHDICEAEHEKELPIVQRNMSDKAVLDPCSRNELLPKSCLKCKQEPRIVYVPLPPKDFVSRFRCIVCSEKSAFVCKCYAVMFCSDACFRTFWKWGHWKTCNYAELL